MSKFNHVALVGGRAKAVTSKSIITARKDVIKWAKAYSKSIVVDTKDWQPIYTPDNQEVGRVEWERKNGKWKFWWSFKNYAGQRVTYRLYPSGNVDSNTKRVIPSLTKLRKKKRTGDGRYVG